MLPLSQTPPASLLSAKERLSLALRRLETAIDRQQAAYQNLHALGKQTVHALKEQEMTLFSLLEENTKKHEPN